jgi:hypothetical protein
VLTVAVGFTGSAVACRPEERRHSPDYGKGLPATLAAAVLRNSQSR